MNKELRSPLFLLSERDSSFLIKMFTAMTQWNSMHLLYVQLRDTVVNGSLLCTRDESIKLAALDCQIQYGNHDETRHKSGYLDLHMFLPNEYRMLKGIE